MAEQEQAVFDGAKLSFEGLGINELFMGVLESLNFTTPTPIQHKAIPAALSGSDVIGIAQTGTGKTLAFGIPMLQRLSATNGGALVLLPTRELAIQVDESLRTFGAPVGIRTAVLIGGESIGKQIAQIRRRPNIIIATPGRLLDLVEHRAIRLEKTSFLILDEADRMLDMGFAPQINKILGMLPKPADRQTLLFSATMPDDIVRIATNHMKMPVRVEVAPAGTAAETVEQELYIVPKENKLPLLTHLLEEYHTGPVLIFTRTKHGATKLARSISALGHRVSEIHADRSLGQRKQALEGFKSGAYRVLVATDIAARGIDVSGIQLVVNYDLPHSSDYVHRIGRTGRAGHEGKAISFATPDQRTEIRDIEKLIRKPLPIAKHPELSVELPERHIPAGQRGFSGGRVRRFGHRPRFNRR